MDADAHSRVWDRYVEEWTGKGWPGDEWGTPATWDAVYRRYFVGVESWDKAVEIGPGSGKYTEKVLQSPGVAVRGYDVSRRYLAKCAERCRPHVESGRLDLRLIDTSTPRFMLDDLSDWKRQVDALYSIGVMVHIDLLYLMPYLVTAAAVLKPGGKLIATFGNPTTERGFQQLLADIKHFWNNPGGKYEWLGGCVVESLLPRLGFEIETLNEPDGINVAVVASVVDPEVGDELTRHL